MNRLDEILALLGSEKVSAEQQYLLHVLLMSIQSFSVATCDDELELACEEKMGQIRADIAAREA
ncbi:hypothetical protein [Aeromonas hydrophila]|uniref:hypothetical protein n=1 Tax=Aeromonas hydrophila TaxID=644 RepID=UPI00235EDDC3|nr:hypothetical protein [Aeromonas hydrophila]